MSDRTSSSSRHIVLAIAIVFVSVVALAYISSGDRAAAPTSAASEMAKIPTASVPVGPAAHRVAVRPVPAGGYVAPPLPVTRREHKWGEGPDFFIRQPIDYPGNMPQRMGNKISMFIYDLEVVKEAIRTGKDAEGRFSEVLGRTLSDAERNAARTALQVFFDNMVPIMDDLMDEMMTLEDGYVVIRAGREELNDDLRIAMNLDENAWYALFPHLETLDRNLDQVDQSIARPLHDADDATSDKG